MIAPDKFRGSLTAAAAATAIATGMARACPAAELVLVPIADGGEGTVEAALWSGYSAREVVVSGPTGQPVRATFAVHEDRVILELASASGLSQLVDGVPAPLEGVDHRHRRAGQSRPRRGRPGDRARARR